MLYKCSHSLYFFIFFLNLTFTLNFNVIYLPFLAWFNVQDKLDFKSCHMLPVTVLSEYLKHNNIEKLALYSLFLPNCGYFKLECI